MKCTNCGNSPGNVDEVRQCGKCQQNGTAAAIHCKYPSGTPIETVVAEANANAFPFVHEDIPAAATIEAPLAKAARRKRA